MASSLRENWKTGRSKGAWKRKVKNNFQITHLKEEDAFNRSKWKKCVCTLKNMLIPTISFTEKHQINFIDDDEKV